MVSTYYSKTCVKQPLSKRPKIGYRLMQVKSIAEFSKESILQYFRPSLLKLPFVIKLFVLSIFEWQFYTGFTVCHLCQMSNFTNNRH